MKNIKNLYKILLYLLPFVSTAISFLILRPSGVMGILLTLLVGVFTYFFLWVINQVLKPSFKTQYVKNLKSHYRNKNS